MATQKGKAPLQVQRRCSKCGSSVGARSRWCHTCGADLRALWVRLGMWSWIIVGAAILPLVVGVVIYHGRSHDATDLVPVEDGQTAATIPDEIQLVSPLRAVISGDRRKVAYVGTKGAEQCLCVNNSVMQCAAEIGVILISGDGSRIAWSEAVRNQLTNEVGWRVVTDGAPGPDYREIRNLEMASGTGRIGYIARSDDGCRYVRGDHIEQVYPDIRWSLLSPDGSRSLYLAAVNGRFTPVVDGLAGPPFDQVLAWSFSQNGRHLAYVGRDSDGTFLMLDGQRSSAPAELSDVALNADGSRLCRMFKTQAGVWFAEGDRTSQVFGAQAANVSFSLTGTINAILSMRDTRQVWRGDDVTKLRRARADELEVLFYNQWWQAMTGNRARVSSATKGDDDGYLVFVEQDGRQLRWHRFHWPPTHITKIDMASREPGLPEARDAVLSALKDRSVERLLAYVDPDIRVGFGDPCCGVAYFRSVLDLDDRSSPFWEQAQRVIENGGLLTSVRGSIIFTAPYTFNLPLPLGPLLGADADKIGLVTGNGTKLRAEPRPDSTALKTFDWEPAAYLSFADENQGNADLEKRWIRVRTLDGLEGYIERGSLSSGYDRRAVFEKRNGRWIITEFSSGD